MADENTPNRRKGGGDVILYTGGADVREITREQWEAAGVQDQDTVVFNAENKKRVPADELTGDARQLLLDGHKHEFMLNEFQIPAPNGE